METVSKDAENARLKWRIIPKLPYTVIENYILFCIVLQVLDVISPPYTPEFVQLFLPLVESADITGTLRNEEENDPVSEFIGKEC